VNQHSVVIFFLQKRFDLAIEVAEQSRERSCPLHLEETSDPVRTAPLIASKSTSPANTSRDLCECPFVVCFVWPLRLLVPFGGVRRSIPAFMSISIDDSKNLGDCSVTKDKTK
jgi:hypothetical protein